MRIKSSKGKPVAQPQALSAKVARGRAKAATPPKRVAREGSKLALLLNKLSAASGASLDEIAGATGWQRHSIRGAISGHIKKKLSLKVVSAKDENGVRRYRIAA